MSFLKKHKTSDNISTPKKPSKWKSKPAKVTYLVLGFCLIFCASYLGYLYSTGSKIFDKDANSKSSIFSIIKGEQSDILKQDRVNILLLGYGGSGHPGAYLTDSIMLVSLDVKNNKVALMNIPRDLYVPIKGHGNDKINAAYSDGYNDYMQKSCKSKNQNSCTDDALMAGANLSMQTISNVFGIPIQYYVSADFSGFEQMINSVGGVDVYVDKAIYDPFYPAYDNGPTSVFSVSVGQRHMDGALALKYARSRETSSDFDRSRRQQQIFAALKDKVVQAGTLSNPKKIADFANILGSHIRTDLSPNEIVSLAGFMKNIDKSKIINQILSTDAGGPLVGDSSSGTYYIVTRKGNFDDLKTLTKNIFNQSTSTVAVKVEVLNGSSITGAGTKVSDLLKANKFEVTSVQNSSTKYQKTILYDYTGGNQNDTISFLQDHFENLMVVEKTKDASQKADFTLIIGSDYKLTSQK